MRLMLSVVDADGAAVNDAMIEIWQADADGNHECNADPAFRRFGRLCTDEQGFATFETIKPGATSDAAGGRQAPHINVMIFARGLLKQLFTRVYFDGEPENGRDRVLALVPEDRKATLLATRRGESPETWELEIRLSGDRETVFFDV